MRNRDARLSHAAEFVLGSGSPQRTSPTTSPSGGRIVRFEFNVGPGSFGSVDSKMDWRDRWLTMNSQLLNSDWYTAFGGTSSIPGGDVDTLQYPNKRTAEANKRIAVFNGDGLFTAKGWDAANVRGAPNFFNWGQWIRSDTGNFLDIYIYADNLTGGLTVWNDTAERYQGILDIFAGEQENVRIIIP